jgi:hypothetical protein
MRRLFVALLISVIGLSVATADEIEVVGAEDIGYQLRLATVADGQSFSLDNEKPTLLIKGCALVSQSKTLIELNVIDGNEGVEITVFAPEAGRHSKVFREGDYAERINAKLQITDIATLRLQKTGDVWRMEIGESADTPRFFLLDSSQGASQEITCEEGSGQFTLDLETYALTRETGNFRFRHAFRGRFIRLFNVDGIVFRPDEIMLRTYESRLSQRYNPGSSSSVTINVDRTPPASLIGATLRFGGSSQNGANLATVRSVNPGAKTVTVVPWKIGSANTHPAGRWIRAYKQVAHDVAVANQYPIAYLPPHDWTEGGEIAGAIAQEFAAADPTGFFSSVDIGAGGGAGGGGEIGFRLRNVTHSHDGINFEGGMYGVVAFEMQVNFFGKSLDVGPAELDISLVFDQVADEIISVNTYRKDAWVFYFNPEALAESVTRGTRTVDFPLTFRLYFDRSFELNGGGMRIRLPKPFPISPLKGVSRLGGGFSRPSTFEVDARFTDLYMKRIPSVNRDFWRCDAAVVLSMDEGYLYMVAGGTKGKVDGMRLLEKVDLGSAEVTVQWDRSKRPAGQRWEGIVFDGTFGINLSQVNVGFGGGFRIRDWPNSLYVGGRGCVSGSAFGINFGSLNTYLNRERLRFTARAGISPFRVSHTAEIKWRDMRSYLTPFSMDMSDTDTGSMGVSRIYTDDGFEVVLVPEARRLGSRQVVQDDSSLSTLGMLQPLSGETIEPFTLEKAYPEILLSIEYNNTTSAVASVTLPGSIGKSVIIVTEEDQDTIDPNVLYGLDFRAGEDDDPENLARQMLITIPEAEAGDYTLTFGLPQEQVDLFEYFEVIPVPGITNLTAAAVPDKSGHVALTWQTEPVVTNAHYQLIMQKVDGGDTIENELPIYGLFEDVDEDEEQDEPDVTQVMRLLPPEQIVRDGEITFSIELKLPENLVVGNYRFVLEPIVLEHDGEALEEPLHGDAAESAPLYAHTEDSSIPPPDAVWAQAIGNGLIRVGWTHSDEPDEWNVTILQDNAPTGAVTLVTTDLAVGVNQSIVTNIMVPPYTDVTTNNYLDIGGPDNPLATRNVLELEYGVEYQFDVTAVRKDVGYWSNPERPIYDATDAYHDLNIAEAHLHDGTLDFLSPASRASATATEPQTIWFEVFLEDDETPVASVSLYEEGVPGLQYDVENDIVTLRERVLGWDTLGVDAFDKIRIEAEIPYERVGLTLRDGEGVPLIRLPPINLPELLALDASAQDDWITANVPAEYQDHVRDLVEGGVFAATSTELTVLMNAFNTAFSGGDPLAHGRYQVDIEAYTAANDVTYSSFTINLNALPFGENLYSLSYSSGHGGHVDGTFSQSVLHGATGTLVTAVATNDGVVFSQWSDGLTTPDRQDGPLHGHRHAYAAFTTTNGVPIDWYVANGIAPGDGQTWSDLDDQEPHADGYTYRMAYVAGTNPLDPDSRLRILDMGTGWPVQIVFDPEVIGRRYALEFRTNLLEGAWELAQESQPEEWDGGRIGHHAPTNSPSAFYRIRVIDPNED